MGAEADDILQDPATVVIEPGAVAVLEPYSAEFTVDPGKDQAVSIDGTKVSG